MNTDIFWRLVWKEYRQQLALWIAIIFAGFIFQLGVVIFCVLNGEGVSPLPDRLFTVALSVPILYALGCGATLFAGEHESHSFPFQQSLPVSATRVFWAKVSFAVVSALVLFPLLWLLAFAMTGWVLPRAEWHYQLWGGGVVATIEILVWAVFASLLLRRVLPAAIASGVVAVFVSFGAMLFSSPFTPYVNEYFSTLPIRVLLALFGFCIALRLGSRWFDETPQNWGRMRVKRRSSRAAPVVQVTQFRMFLRLVWHGLRQNLTTILWIVVAYIVFSIWLLTWSSRGGDELAIFGLIFIASLLGGTTFAGDQRESRFLFFTEHGVPPRLVWLSRITAAVLPLMALGGVAVIIYLLRSSWLDHELDGLYTFVAAAFTIFASGQLCSMLIRSNIVAMFASLICMVLLVMWGGLMFNFGVPKIITVLPLPLIFFGAGWLYTPKWLQQRTSWRARGITAASIVIPLLGVVAATATYRVVEIPAIKLSVDPVAATMQTDSPAARKTAEMYRSAEAILWPKMQVRDGKRVITERDDEWQKGIALFLEASQRPDCRFRQWGDEGEYELDENDQIITAVFVEAQARLVDGDHEGAQGLYWGLLRYAAHYYQQRLEAIYPEWGSHVERLTLPRLAEIADDEEQTSEDILKLVGKLQEFFDGAQPNWDNCIFSGHLSGIRFLSGDPRFLEEAYGVKSTERIAMRVLSCLMPWERYRNPRLLDVSTEAEIQGFDAMRERAVRIAPTQQSALPWDVRLQLANGEQQLIRSSDIELWAMSSPTLMHATMSLVDQFATWERQHQAARNAALVQLALIAWQKEKGTYPETLIELEGYGFEELPLDPYTNQPFVYFPNGSPFEVWDDEVGMESMGGAEMASEAMADEDMMAGFGGMMVMAPARIEHTAPMIWSPGETLQFTPTGRSNRELASPTLDRFTDSWGHHLQGQEVLTKGNAYLLPVIDTTDRDQQPSDSSDNADALPSDE